jgi:hypothetical protein
MQLYADENFPLPVVEELRQLGHDVLTAQDDGRQATPDPDNCQGTRTFTRLRDTNCYEVNR